MNRCWRFILPATLSVLALATSASAECAWILWAVAATQDAQTTRANPLEWSPQAGFVTATACQTALADFTQKALAGINRNAVVWETFIYRCLPDTVDPRGPKGK